VEVKESFENYAVLFEDGVSRVPVESLRSAFVQVFNRFIPEADIQKGLLDDVRSASSRKDSLAIEEYRRLYFKFDSPLLHRSLIVRRLKGPEGLETLSLPKAPSSRISTPPTRLATTLPAPAPAAVKASSSQRSFWKSQHSAAFLVADEDELELQSEEVSFQIQSDRHAVGSALSAARSVNTSRS
jgi:hypothetical protein